MAKVFKNIKYELLDNTEDISKLPPIELFDMFKELVNNYNELVSLVDPNPSSSHLKADLQGWCDVRGISYDVKETKSQLLAKVNTWNS